MSEYAKNIQTIEDLWKKRIELRDRGGRMSEYIITCDDEVATWVGNDVESMKKIVRCRDCKHSYEDKRCTSTGWVDVLVCESNQWSTSSLMPSHTVNNDGFCAWAERREP